MTVKVGIIGGGVVGSAIAYHLSQDPQYQVSLWESRSPNAFGATGAALGVLMAVISPKLKGKHLRMRLESIRAFDNWIDDLQTQTGLEIPYNRQGIIQLMFDPEQFQRWEKTETVRARQGFRLERWSREETLEKFPFVAAAKDVETNQPLIGAVYSPSDRQLNPVSLTQALRQAAIQNGAEIHYECSVESFETIPSDSEHWVSGVQVADKIIPLDRVILSAGLNATSLTTELNQAIPIYPVLGQAMRLKLNTPWPLPTPVINGAHVHLVPLSQSEIWVGATVEFPDSETKQPLAADPSLLEAIRQQAIALYPDLAQAEVVETWSGLRPRPAERAAPIIEWLPHYQNVIVATAHYRNGVLLAPVTATRVAKILQEQ